MPRYEHTKLVERIAHVDTAPQDTIEYGTWLEASGHLNLLRDNALEDELIIYAADGCTFVHSVVVPNDRLVRPDHGDLLQWSGNPFIPRASYLWGGREGETAIDQENGLSGSRSLEDAQLLVFGRDFEGMKGQDALYYEVLQEYSHLTSIHWRIEQRAYCRFDENGDFEHVVSVTSGGDHGGISLVSFKRGDLEEYLVAKDSALVRLFDITLFRRDGNDDFMGWSNEPEQFVVETGDFFYRQKVDVGKAAYTRGVQIIRPPNAGGKTDSMSIQGRGRRREGDYVTFLADDWRNRRIANVSTDPSATTNYFEANENSLPYEVSPAFFRPEVLLKYKADREKYAINEEHRFISCRGGWELRTYDINEAGQVHTYIRYLRELPYEEQLYWRSFNEEPKAEISQRAVLNDFEAEASVITDPLQDILSVVRRWANADVAWWKLRDDNLLQRVNTPRTNSRDEWAQSFLDVSKLVVEGFHVGAIRAKLDEMSITFDKDERSVALMEKALPGVAVLDDSGRLRGLRDVQEIRSKVASHSGGRAATDLANAALERYGTYSAHFEAVCRSVMCELSAIEQAFGVSATTSD